MSITICMYICTHCLKMLTKSYLKLKINGDTGCSNIFFDIFFLDNLCVTVLSNYELRSPISWLLSGTNFK